MGQRGYKKRRNRCALVDAKGQRCSVQVKKAGNRYCCAQHAAAARPAGHARVAPGSRARHQAAVGRLAAHLRAALVGQAEDGRVTIDAAVQVALDAAQARYDRGYTAGYARMRHETSALRLQLSKAALDDFLGSRFGNGFITGDLKPAELAKFKFGGQ
jgi:hypothetical protein